MRHDMSDAPAIEIETKDQALIARLAVKMLDDQQLKQLAQAVDHSAGADSGISVIVLDLSKVHLMPSLALGLLVQIANKCKARQQKLKLAGVQQQLRQVFAITRLDRVLELAPSVDAALI